MTKVSRQFDHKIDHEIHRWLSAGWLLLAIMLFLEVLPMRVEMGDGDRYITALLMIAISVIHGFRSQYHKDHREEH